MSSSCPLGISTFQLHLRHRPRRVAAHAHRRVVVDDAVVREHRRALVVVVAVVGEDVVVDGVLHEPLDHRQLRSRRPGSSPPRRGTGSSRRVGRRDRGGLAHAVDAVADELTGGLAGDRRGERAVAGAAGARGVVDERDRRPRRRTSPCTSASRWCRSAAAPTPRSAGPGSGRSGRRRDLRDRAGIPSTELRPRGVPPVHGARGPALGQRVVDHQVAQLERRAGAVGRPRPRARVEVAHRVDHRRGGVDELHRLAAVAELAGVDRVGREAVERREPGGVGRQDDASAGRDRPSPAGRVAVMPWVNDQPDTSIGLDAVLASSMKSSVSRSEPAW